MVTPVRGSWVRVICSLRDERETKKLARLVTRNPLTIRRLMIAKNFLPFLTEGYRRFQMLL